MTISEQEYNRVVTGLVTIIELDGRKINELYDSLKAVNKLEESLRYDLDKARLEIERQQEINNQFLAEKEALRAENLQLRVKINTYEDKMSRSRVRK